MRLLLLLLVAVGMMSCSPATVKYDYDREASFSNYKTYRWLQIRRNQSDAPMGRGTSLLEKHIRQAVDKELAEKGYRLVQERDVDFLVAFHAGVREKIDVTRYGYGSWRRPWQAVTVRRYKEGTLVLDVIDREKKQLVWRSWGSSVVNDPAKRDELIREAVHKMLAKFPPK